MNKRINEKIGEIEEFLSQLNEIAPDSLDKYNSNIEKKAACERYAEKIIEAITDLAFIIIKQKNLKMPDDDFDAFSILSNNGIIDEKLSRRLKDAKGMRNILVHEYGKVDDKIVFNAVDKELEKDVRSFIERIKK